MARTRIDISTNRSIEEINNVLGQYFQQKGFQSIKYGNGEIVMKLSPLPGIVTPHFIKIYIANGYVTVEGWVKAFGAEYELDDDFFLNLPKKQLRKTFDEIRNIIGGQQAFNGAVSNVNPAVAQQQTPNGTVSNVNPGVAQQQTPNGTVSNVNPGVAQQQNFMFKADLKQYAIISAIIGAVLFVVPLPLYIIFLLSIAGVVVGVMGIKSSLKWLSIIGILVCTYDFVATVIFFATAMQAIS